MFENLNKSYVDKLIERFETKFEIDEATGCHEWKGHTKPDGYGSFRVGHSPQLAHRVAYTLFVGEIPDGLYVCHSCDNRSCVSVDHLWLGTPRDNINDMMNKERQLRGEINPRAKLTENKALAIRLLSSNGFTPEVLGEMFEVTPRQVRRIISRKAWNHI